MHRESLDGAPPSPVVSPEIPADGASKHGGSRPGAGRKPRHGLRRLRTAVTQLTTRRLDGRTVVAREVRRWKEDVRRDLGGDLTRAQETIREAAQSWVILFSLDDYIARQPTLVTKKRQVVPVVLQRMQILARHLERLGLERKAKEMDLAAVFAALRRAHVTGRPGGESRSRLVNIGRTPCPL